VEGLIQSLDEPDKRLNEIWGRGSGKAAESLSGGEIARSSDEGNISMKCLATRSESFH